MDDEDRYCMRKLGFQIYKLLDNEKADPQVVYEIFLKGLSLIFIKEGYSFISFKEAILNALDLYEKDWARLKNALSELENNGYSV